MRTVILGRVSLIIFIKPKNKEVIDLGEYTATTVLAAISFKVGECLWHWNFLLEKKNSVFY